MMNRTRIRGRPAGGTSAPRSRSFVGPDVGVAALVAGDAPERVGPARVLLDRGQRVVQDDRVALELEVVEAALDVDAGAPGHRRPSSPRRLGVVPWRVDLPPLRYLSAADVVAAMPDLDERLRLAERTLTALVADAELPPKIGVHPRPAGLVRPRHAGLPARRRSGRCATTCSG